MALSHPIPRPKNAKDLLGQQFGRLTVIAFAGITTKSQGRWLCQCSCHERGWVVVNVGDLTSGNTTSCGCVRREARIGNGHRTTHGLSHTRAYNIWHNMIARCYNPKSDAYHRYGALGIVVCDRWRHSIENFYEDMGERPVNMEIDRTDPTGPYSPENCRWVSEVEQARNKTNSCFVEFNGERKTVAEWGDVTGIRASIIWSRIFISGWSIPDALSVVPSPAKTKKRKPYKEYGTLTLNGEEKSIGEWSKLTGVSHSVILQRLEKGKTTEEALSASVVNRHGMSSTPEYQIWQKMRYRCENPKDADYPICGGRGIKVCQRWSESFENFLADMGPRPSRCAAIRTNPDGDYCPENCRWTRRMKWQQYT